MSNFFASLWESVFTPGTTPTLLVATNASFACLQVILFALLLATYSIHFIILSFLCAGLWFGINWFVAELKVAQLEEEKKQKKLQREKEEITKNDDQGGNAGDSSDTETEEATPAPEDRKIQISTSTSTTASSKVKPEDSEGPRKRKTPAVASEPEEGWVSTDSEWEKVDQ